MIVIINGINDMMTAYSEIFDLNKTVSISLSILGTASACFCHLLGYHYNNTDKNQRHTI